MSIIYPEFTASSTTAVIPIGTEVQDPSTGYIYKYVQISASSATAGSVGRAFYKTATANVVSDDYTGGDGLYNAPAGIGISTIAKSSFGFILIDGYYASLRKEASAAITANDMLVGSTTDGAVTLKTAGEALLIAAFGTCAATVTAGTTTVSGMIKCR